MPIPDEKTPEEYDVVVSGAGPGGLASAWHAANQGKKVLILDAREMDYVRVQRVFLDEESRLNLLNMLGSDWNDWGKLAALHEDDRAFVLELNRSTTVAVKDIENFIKRRLEEQENVVLARNTKIDRIDLQEGRLDLIPTKGHGPTQPIKFTNLIAADGARHETVDTYNKSAATPIGYNPIPGPKHKFHAGVYFNVSSENIIKLPVEQFVETATNVPGLPYPLICGISFDKKSYIDSKGKSVKCTFGGEIPQEIYEILTDKTGRYTEQQKQEAIIAHLQKVLPGFFAEHGLKNEDLQMKIVEGHDAEKPHKTKEHIEQKNKMKLQPFHLSLMQADKSIVSENNHSFILVGDTFRNPNYQFGHGLNDALRHSAAVGKLLNNEMTPKAYNSYCKELADKISVATKAIRALKSVGRKLLIQAAHSRTEAVRQNFLGKYNIDPAFEQKLEMIQVLDKVQSFKLPDNLFQAGTALQIKSDVATIGNNVMHMKQQIASAVIDQMDALAQYDSDKKKQYDLIPAASATLKSLAQLNNIIDDMLEVLASYKVKQGDGNTHKIKMLDELATTLANICAEDLSDPDKLSQDLIKTLEQVFHSTRNAEKKPGFFNIKGAYRALHSNFLQSIQSVLKKHPEFPKTINLPVFEESAQSTIIPPNSVKK